MRVQTFNFCNDEFVVFDTTSIPSFRIFDSEGQNHTFRDTERNAQHASEVKGAEYASASSKAFNEVEPV